MRLPALLLALLAVTAGCSALGPGTPTATPDADERLRHSAAHAMNSTDSYRTNVTGVVRASDGTVRFQVRGRYDREAERGYYRGRVETPRGPFRVWGCLDGSRKYVRVEADHYTATHETGASWPGATPLGRVSKYLRWSPRTVDFDVVRDGGTTLVASPETEYVDSGIRVGVGPRSVDPRANLTDLTVRYRLGDDHRPNRVTERFRFSVDDTRANATVTARYCDYGASFDFPDCEAGLPPADK